MLYSALALWWVVFGRVDQLNDAIQRGDDTRALAIVRAHPGVVNQTDQYGHMPFAWAAGFQRLAVVRMLLKRGARVNAYGPRDAPALCVIDSVEGVKFLLRAGADPNIGDPVVDVCYWGGPDAIPKLLILVRHGASLEARNVLGDTPLLLACKFRNVEIASELIRLGADVNARDLAGRTPLVASLAPGELDGRNYRLLDVILAAHPDLYARGIEGDAMELNDARLNDPVVAKKLLDAGYKRKR